MERLQKSMNAYVKTLSKRQEGDDKEKTLPIAYLGSTMVNHGEDFEEDSDFGQCLQSLSHLLSHRNSLKHVQAWVEPMNGLDASRKHMWQKRQRAGSSRWSGLWYR